MNIISILAGAAIALAATVGSASAADRFTTIAGFEAQAMTQQEMGWVRGSVTLQLTPPPDVDLARVIDVQIPVALSEILIALINGHTPVVSFVNNK